MSSISSQQQQQQHQDMIPKQCFACGENILISKPDANSPWIKKNLDAITDHVCSRKKKQSSSSSSSSFTPSSSSSSSSATTFTVLAALEKRISTLAESVTSLEHKIDQLKLEFIALKAVLNDKRQ